MPDAQEFDPICRPCESFGVDIFDFTSWPRAGLKYESEDCWLCRLSVDTNSAVVMCNDAGNGLNPNKQKYQRTRAIYGCGPIDRNVGRINKSFELTLHRMTDEATLFYDLFMHVRSCVSEKWHL